MPIQMQLARIIISELTESQVIYLREVDGEREFPILIGIFEATNIDRRVKEDGYEPPRPLTHDLVVRTAEALDATVHSVVISELSEQTYYAQLWLKTKSGDMVDVDCRPSDAIAVAVTFSPALPIYVAEDVLDEVASGMP